MPENPMDTRIANLSLMLDLNNSTQQHVINALKAVGMVAGVAKGTPLFQEGESHADDGYILLSGSIDIRSETGFRKVLFAPALIGEMKQFAFTTDDERLASVTAAEELEVLRFNWDAFYKELSEHLGESQLEQFKEALRRYAWMHFLELEDDL